MLDVHGEHPHIPPGAGADGPVLCWGASRPPFFLISHDVLPITGINSKPSLRTWDEEHYLSWLSEEADNMTGEISGIIKKNKGLGTLLHRQQGWIASSSCILLCPILP